MAAFDLLIVAPHDDLHARAVWTHLNRWRASVEWIDLSALVFGDRLTLAMGDQTRCIFEKGARAIDIREAKTVWWRRPDSIVGHDLDRQVSDFVIDEWTEFLNSIESCADSRWVNVPSNERKASSRLYQLKEARDAGLRVPRTLVTNQPSAVRGFASSETSVVYKRIGTRRSGPAVPTRSLVASDLNRLDELAGCPAMFQEYVHGLDVRVTFIGGACHGVEIHAEGGSFPTDSRLDLSVPVVRHDLDEEVTARLRILMGKLGLAFGAIDMRLTATGEYVFFEVNPSGQFLFIELLAGLPLSAELSRYLAGELETDEVHRRRSPGSREHF